MPRWPPGSCWLKSPVSAGARPPSLSDRGERSCPAQVPGEQENDLVFELLWIDWFGRREKSVNQRFDGGHDQAGAEPATGMHRRVFIQQFGSRVHHGIFQGMQPRQERRRAGSFLEQHPMQSGIVAVVIDGCPDEDAQDVIEMFWLTP